MRWAIPLTVCESGDLPGFEQDLIRRNQGQIEYPRGRDQKPIGRIAMRQLHAVRLLRDLEGHASFSHGGGVSSVGDPTLRIWRQREFLLLSKIQTLPQRDRGKPELVVWILHRAITRLERRAR